MEPSAPRASPSAKLWRILRAVYYVLLEGFSKHKLALRLHLLSRRGKLAARAVSGAVLAAARPRAPGGSAASYLSSLSCRSMDPAAAAYRPREVEFSCSSTPRPGSRRRGSAATAPQGGDVLDSATVRRLFEMLDTEEEAAPEDEESGAVVTPAAAAAARQVRITDSPFLAKEDEEGVVDGAVDRRAEEFILWFHEQLRTQHGAAARERTTYSWVR